MSIQVQSIAATRTTDISTATAFVATEVSVDFTLTGSDTFTGHDALIVELHGCQDDYTAGVAPLASVSISTPTGTTESALFTSAQMNQPFTAGKKSFWFSSYTTGPGDKLIPVWQCDLTLVNIHASLRTDVDDPPDGALELSIAQGDARYAPIAAGAPSDVTAPLASLADSRGTVGSHCYDTTTGILYRKTAITPAHVWIGWQTFNEV